MNTIKLKEYCQTILMACVLSTGLIACGGSDSKNPPVVDVKIEKNIQALILNATGQPLADVTIHVLGQTAKTDAQGRVNFKVELPQATQNVVVNFQKEGYINQAVLYKVEQLTALKAHLLAIKQSLSIEHIEQAQLIESPYLGTRLTIPAAAFVTETGAAATGEVQLHLTPWDIKGADLNAMPANGMAIFDAQGNTGQLISAGMISATFLDAAGKKLQLAAGKTVDIQMHLAWTEIHQHNLTVGSSIPMWFFNESKGLWEQEGTGTVVADPTSSTGLAVHAKVAHFSTWNWDFKFEEPGSVEVKCQSAAQDIPCYVTAKIVLNNGSSLVHSNNLDLGWTTIINMPSTGTIHWSANSLNGELIGETSSNTSGQVIIQLAAPTTKNKVQCVLADQSPVACSGELSVASNGQIQSRLFSAETTGLNVLSNLLVGNQPLQWRAQSIATLENNQWVVYHGTATSNTSENVTIELNQKQILASEQGMKFQLLCGSYDFNQNSNWLDPALLGQACQIKLAVQVYENSELVTHYYNFDAVYGEAKQIQLPNLYLGFKDVNNTALNGELESLRVSSSMLEAKLCGSWLMHYEQQPTYAELFQDNPLYHVTHYSGFISDNPQQNFNCENPSNPV